MTSKLQISWILFLVVLGFVAIDTTFSFSQTEESVPTPILSDNNGDLNIDVLAFGDSITRGTGDRNPPYAEIDSVEHMFSEAGYPKRVEKMLNIPVDNYGNPGESLVEDGMRRFLYSIRHHAPDVAIISEGTNDARYRADTSKIYNCLQTMINVASYYNTFPVLMNLAPTCCDHSGQYPYIKEYNNVYKAVALTNDITLANISHAFSNICNSSRCYLLNLPEGLHPNIEGYNIMAEVVAAALLGIDIFAPEGPTFLDQALGRAPGTAKTKPDPVPVVTTQ